MADGNRTTLAVAVAGITAAALVGIGGSAVAAETQVITCLGKRATIVGTNGNDVLSGTDRKDVIAGLGGNDSIYNSDPNGPDLICGGNGNDVIGGDEHRTGEQMLVSGDAGDDQIDAGYISYQASPVGVRVDVDTGRATGWGSDSFNAEPARIVAVIGSQHDDVLIGAGRRDPSGEYWGTGLVGLDGNDTLLSRRGGDGFAPGAGDDVVEGGTAATTEFNCDSVHYGAFKILDSVDDPGITYTGSPAPVRLDLAAGTAVGWGRDRVMHISRGVGSRFSDVLLGSRRRTPRYCKDILEGRAGNDVLFGRAGPDVLIGEGGNDRLDGGPGRDTLGGYTGNDVLSGRANNDRLSGGRGRDHLDGGAGSDRLDGGPGTDSCARGERRVNCEEKPR